MVDESATTATRMRVGGGNIVSGHGVRPRASVWNVWVGVLRGAVQAVDEATRALRDAQVRAGGTKRMRSGHGDVVVAARVVRARTMHPGESGVT